jgi:2-hydroxychromene-2-carboxylate isomerase
MRGYLYLSDDQKNNYLNTFFEAYWKDNFDLSNDEEILKLLNTLNIDNEKFLNGIKEQSIKDALKDSTNEAFKKEVFGAPTFIANNKIFWGQDRLEYAVEELI